MEKYLNNPNVLVNGIPEGYEYLTDYSIPFTKKRLGDQLQCFVTKQLNAERRTNGNDLFIVVTIDRMLFVDCVLNGVPCILDFGTNGFKNSDAYWTYYPNDVSQETRTIVNSSPIPIQSQTQTQTGSPQWTIRSRRSQKIHKPNYNRASSEVLSGRPLIQSKKSQVFSCMVSGTNSNSNNDNDFPVPGFWNTKLQGFYF